MLRLLLFSLAFMLHCCGLSLYSQTIHITNKDSDNKEEVISQLLSMQRSWQIDIRKKQPSEKIERGFLFVGMELDFVRDLIDNKNTIIIWASCDDAFAGYIILTPIKEFFDLYKDSPIRTFDSNVNEKLFEEYLNTKQVRYVEQIAVNPKLTQTKIATALMDEAKRISPNGLVAAVITQPVYNQASLCFFAKNDYAVMGHLNCVECAEWPAYQTRVLFWPSLDGF